MIAAGHMVSAVSEMNAGTKLGFSLQALSPVQTHSSTNTTRGVSQMPSMLFDPCMSRQQQLDSRWLRSG